MSSNTLSSGTRTERILSNAVILLLFLFFDYYMTSVRNRMKKVLLDGGIDESLSSDDSVTDTSRKGKVDKIVKKMEKLADEGIREEEENAENSDDSTTTSIRGKQTRKANSTSGKDTKQEYADFIAAIKAWLHAEEDLLVLKDERGKIAKKIKEIEEIKKQHEPIIAEFLNDDEQGGSAKISDGSTIELATKNKTESYSLKTIPKYMEEVFIAIKNRDLVFIKEKLVEMYDEKNCPDINWHELPGDAEAYLQLLIDDPKLLSNVAGLYAANARHTEEIQHIKRKELKGKGKGKRGRK
jgi:hypothetical protein